MKKRIISLMLAAVLALLTLSACGESKTPAITFRETVVTENEYCYWMSYYKGYFLQSYFGQTQDNAAVWSTEMAEGVTIGDYLGALAQTSVMSMVVYLQLFDEYGLTLTTEEENAVDKTMDDLIKSQGNKAALNSVLSAYYINTDILREIKLDQLRITKIQDYLFGENGIEKPTGAELAEFYNENYYHVKYIFISNQKDYVRDENGEFSVKDDGSYATRDLTAAEKLEKKALVDDLALRITAGEDFDTLMNEYTMDMGMLYFPDGYYFSNISTYLNYIDSAAVANVPKMAIDEVETVETVNGWYIVKRLPLVEDAYLDEANIMLFADLEGQVTALKSQEIIASFADEILPNPEVLENCKLAYSTPNFYY